MPVVDVLTRSQFDSLKTAPLLIVDFFAVWCGPCKAIGPVFNKIAEKPEYSAASFARLDVDKLKDVAQECGIQAMPTFMFFKNGQKVDEIKGADPQGLEARIKTHVGTISATSGAGPSLVRGMVSLNEKLDIKQLEILNATDSSSVRALLDPKSKSVTKSDSDEQLMIYLPFQESIKAHSIVVRVNPESLAHAPSALQIFVNRPNILSFEDVGSVPATQQFTEGDISYNGDGEALITLRYVKFQKVNSLVIFVEQNKSEDDVTIIRSLEILGAVEATNSSGVVKKIDHDHD